MEEKRTPASNLPKLNTQFSFASFGTQNTNTVTPRTLPKARTVLDYVLNHVTFYRIHLAAFTFIPLIVSGIFYGSNGEYKISYLDSVFLCYSAMTVTGLTTVNLSTLTPWQQVILYFLMIIGDITIVSWIMVLIRKRFFRTHCEYTAALRRKRNPKRKKGVFLNNISSPVALFRQRQPVPDQSVPPEVKNHRTAKNKLRVNVSRPTPSGTLSGEHDGSFARPLPTTIMEAFEPEEYGEGDKQDSESSENAVLDANEFTSSPQAASVQLQLSPTKELHESPSGGESLKLTPSRELHESPSGGVSLRLTTSREMQMSPTAADFGMTEVFPNDDRGMSTGTDFDAASPRSVHFQHPMIQTRNGRPAPVRGATMLTSPQRDPVRKSTMTTGFGGYPGPLHIMNQVAKRAAPRAYGRLERKFTIASHQTIDESQVSWLNFSGLIVNRNSDFRTETLSDDQVEQLGGAEYRALRLLSYLVPAYFVFCQLISYTLFAPWLSTTNKYDSVFENQPQAVKKPWFGLFQIMAAYTGGGVSLVDFGMIPFQDAYLMIFGMMFSILAGNHAMPIFLRFIIWASSKFTTAGSGPHQALTFLLDHPRRCFLYLFPSHQTWFLLICLVLFSILEWAGFLILNIGIPVYEAIPTGTRVIAGLFQGLAARASGFSIVPIASLAPSLQFMYIVMMYIAIYPVALSIRSTNVYEEQSLGVFEAPPDDEDEEPGDLSKLDRKERVGRYLSWHLRRQTSIDIWWLVWGLFIIIIIERENLMDEDKKWFDVFRVIFELVSAFGGIGLTLGFPSDNYSFVGAMKPLSKLVVIVIMVRGRHRGLPVAVDRAVQLPMDMVTGKNKPDTANEKLQEENRNTAIPGLFSQA
ncbi:TrkH-domain-containing protein [Coprinopsis marcescibilis]|uniref:TrkH-domain-containing protein n=1 Tax=Coprinopsis marcescibilis TaxID=230819 RepID=A0A5C3L3R6_COPMA|nr:TrkH-domain-containing protein [Coprinopsis marcescibilis]